ncbi:MAG: 23S rRNA (guanosine(2251)-2'-O)-methyltransferase RlmB [Saprospirales bacterium]|nr:23S rRNA (guanosine(2251)-2'-O)-methyltransferase RlmB [Saprospirales bacterium]MBK8489548.1 23S rRNA (guanosine(2251)-2'-O)-methyltransferase RlmB [Saprospirales bacterium]
MSDPTTSSNLIFGRHPVVEAIEGGQTIEKVLLQQGTRGELEKTLRHLCKAKGIPLQYVPKEKLDYLVKGGNHQGLAALITPIPYQDLDQLLASLPAKGESALLILLDGVTDVRNFGAIARSAEICGAHALVIPQQGGAAINADAIKTSAGALTRIPVCRESSILTAIDLIKSYDIQILASSLENSQLIYEIDLKKPTAIILGSEGKGIQPPLLRAADQRIRIPQVGETESFNVSVAAGIMLYEAVRQRSL